MELMDRLTRSRWASLWLGVLMALGCGIAVLGFGAPGWILVPVTWIGITIFQTMRWHVDQHTGRRRY
jgi:hypothetical protein